MGDDSLTFLYRLLLTLNETSWMVVVYGIKSAWSFFGVPSWIFACILLLIPVALSGLSLIVAKGLGTDSLTACQESSLADNEFVPTYLGYFFVSLSVPDDLTMVFLYGIVFAFTWISQTQYFNPLYLLFGYHYYHVLTMQGTRVFVIVKGKVIRNKNEMFFERLKRINDTTYLALKEEKKRI